MEPVANKPLAGARTAWLRNLVRSPALGYADFRYLWSSAFFNSVGMTGEQVVLGWLVLERTDSPFMVGATMGLRMVPLFLLGIPAGAIADRVDRHLLVRGLNLGKAGVMACLGLLVFFNVAALWHILLLTFALGSLRALHQTARQSFAYDIVGASGVVSALSLLALGMRVGGLVGSLAAGSLTARAGPGVAYLVLAAGYLLAALSLLPVRSRGQAAPAERHPVWQNLKEYFREMRHNRSLLGLVVVTGAVEVLGFSHQTLLPSLARDVLKVGPEGLGIMNAIRSVGGILGIVFLSALGETRRKGPMLLGVINLFGVSLVLLGFAPNFALALVVLTLINGLSVLSDILSQSLMQLAVANELRGRAMGSWVLAIGMGPMGHLQVGALAGALSVAFALTFNGAGLLALGLAAAALFPRLRRL